MDVSGEHQLDVLHSMLKQRLSVTGSEIAEKPRESQLEHDEEQQGEAKPAEDDKKCLR